MAKYIYSLKISSLLAATMLLALVLCTRAFRTLMIHLDISSP